MRRVICLFCLPVLILAQLLAAPFAAAGAEVNAEAETETVEKEAVYLEISSDDEDRIYNRYAGMFEGRDISLTMDGADLESLPVLRRFRFNSLDLTIQFEDEYSLSHMKTVDWLLFPEQTEHVYILCNGEMMLKSSNALGRLIISLWICCPDALLNDEPVTKWAQQVYAVDSDNLADIYETDAKLHYVYELADADALEEISGDPVFYGKLIFDVFDDSELTSQECIFAGEAFFDVPSSCLAKTFDEADTAIYIYPVTSVIGKYSNGGEAVSTFTRVLVVDLHSMKKYKDYTAVRNDPPESLTITYTDGEYSTEGAAGAYDPAAAISEIVNSGKYQQTVQAQTYDLSGILPWIKAAEEAAAVQAEAETAVATERTAAETETTAAEAETTTAAAAADIVQIAPEATPAGTTETAAAQAAEPDTKNGQQETTTAEPETKAEVYIDKNVYSWLTEDLLEQIFDALGNDLYRTTYESLKTSKELQKGSKGELVLALQKTLNAFGRNLTEDSSFGSGTLSALHAVQNAYNLTSEIKVNAKTYALLMPALLIYTDEAAASRLLEGRMSYENGNEFVYMQACSCWLDENYYHARVLFEQSGGYKNADSRALNCVLTMPETGVLLGNTGAAGSNATLTIQVNNPDTSAVTCAKVYTADDVLTACLIVRGTDSAKVVLPPGEYRIISGTGYRWYGINDMFGDEGLYETLLFDSGNQTMELRSGYDYTITYNVQEHNDAAVHVGSETLDWEELGD